MRLSMLLLASAAMITASSAALAADVVYEEPPAPAPVVATAYDWSGFYVGVFGGASTGDYEYEASIAGFPDAVNLDVSGGGIFGGAQVGFDYQIDSFVLGVVADIAATDNDADVSASIGGLADASATSELKYLGTVRGRVGYTPIDRFLVYGHGGFAYGETEQTLSVSAGDFTESLTLDEGDTKFGYAVGAGLEYAITDSISVQTEYSYVDLGKDEIFGGSVLGADVSVEEDLSFHAVKAAVNFRF